MSLLFQLSQKNGAREELGARARECVCGCVCVCVNQEAFGLEPFFPPLIVETENPLKRFPPGTRCCPSSSPASEPSGFPSRPLGHLSPPPPTSVEPPERAGESAKPPGHLSWQLHGKAGVCAVWSVPFPLANHGDSAPNANPSSPLACAKNKVQDAASEV